MNSLLIEYKRYSNFIVHFWVHGSKFQTLIPELVALTDCATSVWMEPIEFPAAPIFAISITALDDINNEMIAAVMTYGRTRTQFDMSVSILVDVANSLTATEVIRYSDCYFEGVAMEKQLNSTSVAELIQRNISITADTATYEYNVGNVLVGANGAKIP